MNWPIANSPLSGRQPKVGRERGQQVKVRDAKTASGEITRALRDNYVLIVIDLSGCCFSHTGMMHDHGQGHPNMAVQIGRVGGAGRGIVVDSRPFDLPLVSLDGRVVEGKQHTRSPEAK